MTIKTLIDNGADINHQNEIGETPLHWAIEWQKLGSVIGLTSYKELNPNLQDSHGYAALHRSPKDCWNKIECQVMSQLVINKGANLDLKTNDGVSIRDVLLPSKEEIFGKDEKKKN